MSNSKQGTVPTRNEAWGFYGTMEGQAEQAWPIAMKSIAQATQEPAEAVRNFLDSRSGRYYADDVRSAIHKGAGLEQAVEQATERWMGWRLGRTSAGEIHMPIGTAMLVAYVRFHGKTQA
jgi:hypothetical protein